MSDQIQRMLNRIDPQSSTFNERHDALMNEAMETGGTYAPRVEGHWLIDLHGVRVTGETEDKAQRLWFRIAATRTAIKEATS
ncbi:hypothetical protein [Celeribacter naphthalenivorans]|uniref:hypothetical protein n=1 Tax=Celeribacter naphthalenivorans TaxID=1614694 RepID=UPI001CFA21CD|nr:hypothetical protein [Celeribacter naphthalenivorans]